MRQSTRILERTASLERRLMPEQSVRLLRKQPQRITTAGVGSIADPWPGSKCRCQQEIGQWQCSPKDGQQVEIASANDAR